eukprot:jgi/Botrbrau1/16392/Bobra.0387s0002.1
MSHSKSRDLHFSGTSHSKSPDLGPQDRGSTGIGKLPEELLAKTLGILDPNMLMTARLGCRAFRDASVPCITALRYRSWQAGDSNSVSDLTCRLQVFTSVDSLDLDINKFPIPRFFEAPGVLSVLRRLHLSSPETELCADELGHLATTVAAATQLTALEVSGELCEVPGFGILLSGSLQACTALRDLRLGVCRPPQHVEVWEGLLGKWAQLSRLEALGTVILNSKADFEAVAALTQLTRLSVDVRFGETQHVTLLSSLTAVQSLHVASNHLYRRRRTPIMDHTYELVERMPQLRELDLDTDIWDGDMECTDSLVASLPAITSFRSHFLAQPGWVPDLRYPVGLSKLRKLSIPLECDTPEHAATFNAALTGLQTLEIECSPEGCYVLFCHLPPMNGLTRLLIHRLEEEPEMYTPARFLTGLPRLRHLKLQNVLDVRRWHKDAGYVAGLSELTQLEICLDTCGVEEDVSGFTLAQVQPLTTLTQLRSLTTSEPWASGVACPEFQQALNEPRHQMGLPPVRFTVSEQNDHYTACRCFD